MNDEDPKRNWWIWLIIFLVVVAILYGLIQFFVIARGRRTAPPEIQPTVEPTTEPTPTPILFPTPTTVLPTLAPPAYLPKTGVE